MSTNLSRPFLARPVWRDYVVAYVLIGVGFMFANPSMAMAAGCTIMACGSAIFFCAVACSIPALGWAKPREG